MDWGNVPAWVSGVLSGTSILLALRIIRRDKAKDEREQVSRLVIVVHRRSVKREGTSHEVELLNTSDRNFYDVGAEVPISKADKSRRPPAPAFHQPMRRLRYLAEFKRVARRGGRDGVPRIEGLTDGGTLESNMTARFEVNLSVYATRGKIMVTCKDAAGRYWLIDPITKAMFTGEPFVGGIADWG